MTIRAVAAASARQIVGDRSALFFLVVLPILVVTVLGSTVGGFGEFEIGVVDEGAGAAGRELAAALDDHGAITVTALDSLGEARTAVRRSEVVVAVVLPEGLDDDVRSGREVAIPVIGEQVDTVDQAGTAAVRAVLSEVAGRWSATSFVAGETGLDRTEAAAVVARVAGSGSTGVGAVDVEVVDASSDFLPEGFSYSATTMLVLFIFVNGLAGAGAVIETRRQGIYDRALVAPVRARSLVAGAALTQFGVAVVQSALLVGVGAIVFGVDWGDPVAATLLVLAWSAVGAAFGLLAGTLFRTGEQAGAIGPPIGIALGMLGGCMWPLEIVGPTMRSIGHLVPHAWAVDSWVELLSRGGGVADIAANLAVLVAVAATVLAVAGFRLRRALVS